jgi:PAS domain S-box-containing protein
MHPNSIEFFNNLLNAPHAGIVYVYDIALHRNVFVNERWMEEFGYTAQETQTHDGNFLAAILHPEDVATVMAHHFALAQDTTNEIKTIEYRVRRKDGRYAWLFSADRVFARSEVGQVTQIHGFAHDITRQKDAEQEQKASELRFRAMVQFLPDAVFIASKTGEVLEVNEAACSQLGYSRAELLSLKVFELVAPERRMQMPQRMTDSSEKPPLIESVHLRKDGSRVPVETVVVPIILHGQPAFLGVARDITERLRMERQLQDAQRLEAIGRLAGAVAHDFNNVLASVLGGASMLRDDASLPTAHRELLDDVVNAATRGADLTKQLLTISRRQRTEMKAVDLGSLAEQTLRLVSRLLDTSVKLESSLDSGCFVNGDKGMLDQVVMNLALNARDAMPKGGVLKVACIKRPDGQVVLSVADTGQGISQDVLPHVFEPFYTTKPVGQGTGLGLATVYGIVGQHGGAVSVQSVEGVGTCFTVSLPVCEAPKEATQNATTVPGNSRSLTILLLEDQPLVQRTIKSILARRGHVVLLASTVDEARALWQAHQNDISLLLTDVALDSGNSGTAVAAEFQTQRPALPVVFMSGYDAVLSTMPLEQGLDFLQKPFQAADLYRLLERRFPT